MLSEPKSQKPTFKPKLCQRACKTTVKTEMTMKNKTKKVYRIYYFHIRRSTACPILTGKYLPA
ncbi:MAG: hypothetical protein C0433_06210 [Cyclobacterium sp.]|nr:hypothetical protein [Cyclobacterium sp.]